MLELSENKSDESHVSSRHKYSLSILTKRIRRVQSYYLPELCLPVLK